MRWFSVLPQNLQNVLLHRERRVLLDPRTTDARFPAVEAAVLQVLHGCLDNERVSL